MELKTNESPFNILIGEQLSAVTFVMDYLQVDFDGNQFTFYIWPIVTIDNVDFKFGETNYRDKLCSMITKVVKEVAIDDNKAIVLNFDNNDRIFISLDPVNPDIVCEIATFTDVNDKMYVFS